MKIIQNLIPPVISLAIFVVVAILMSTVPQLNFEVDAYFWTQIVGSTLAMLMTYLVWTPTGEQHAKKDKRIINNKKLYDLRANFIVQEQLFTQLKDFCQFKNNELREDIIKHKLSKQTIDYDVFVLYNKKEKTEEEKARLEALMSEFTPKQIALLEKLNTKGVRFTALTPKHITIGRAKPNSLVNKNFEQFYKSSHIAMKSIWGIFTTCFTYFVVIVPNDSFGLAQVVMIGMWFFTFLMAIYSAIRVGYNSIAVYRDRYNQEQAELCAEFFAYAKLDTATLPKLEKTNDRENSNNN